MSTEIKTIKGRYEVPNNENLLNPKYEDSDLNLTRFFGGKENGAMLQLTIFNSQESSYVQLTQSQVADLAYTLTHAFNKDKYPSD